MVDDFPKLLRALVAGWPAQINNQTVLVGTTSTALSGITAGLTNPDDLTAKAVAGFIRFSTVDDPDDGVTRFATIDVETFTTSYARGEAIAERNRGILLGVRRIGGVIIDRCSTTSGPKEVRWDENDNVRRFVSTHRISTRR